MACFCAGDAHHVPCRPVTGTGTGGTFRTRRVQRLRAWAAFAATFLWVLGAELLPGAHLALHASLGAHTHSDTSTVATRAQRPERCHADADGSHCHTRRTESRLGWDRAAEIHDAARPLDLAHGKGSLAHRGLAFQRPALALAPLASAPFAELLRVDPPPPLRAHGAARAPQTRGPPT